MERLWRGTKEIIRVRVQYASRQQCCKTHKRTLPLPLYIYIYIYIIFIYHYILRLGVCPISCGHIWYYFGFVRTIDCIIQLVTKHNGKYKISHIFQYIYIYIYIYTYYFSVYLGPTTVTGKAII